MRPREAVREGLKLRVVRYSEQMFTALALPLALPQRPPMPPSPRRRSHRELKPANFFLHIKGGDELIIKILDFGLAFLVTEDPESGHSEKLTKTGATLGTLNYFSPEQAMGQRELIAPPTDIWALGVIAFEMLSGHCYFPGSDHTVAVKIANGKLTPPSERAENLSAAFDRWFFKSCALAPEERWQSVGEQAAALAQALGVAEERLHSEAAPASFKQWALDRPKQSDSGALPPVNPLAATGLGLAVSGAASTPGASAPPDGASQKTDPYVRNVDSNSVAPVAVPSLSPEKRSALRPAIVAGVLTCAVILALPLTLLLRRMPPEQRIPAAVPAANVGAPPASPDPAAAAARPAPGAAAGSAAPGAAARERAAASDAKGDAEAAARPGGRSRRKHKPAKTAPPSKVGGFDPAAP